MDWIIDHWSAIVVVLLFLAWVVITLVRAKGMSKDEIYKQIQGWLLQAVIWAESEYGGGTGKLKLSEVYALFVQELPWLAKVVTFDAFSGYVDTALKEMNHLLDTNDAIAEIVEG